MNLPSHFITAAHPLCTHLKLVIYLHDQCIYTTLFMPLLGAAGVHHVHIM